MRPPSRATAGGAKHLSVSASFRRFVLDLLDEMGDVEPRSMFGGVGLYCRGTFFGILAGDVLYLKADAETRYMFTSTGSHPFTPYPGRSGSMQYYSVPVGILENPTELARWTRHAVAAGERQARQDSTKKAKRVRPTPTPDEPSS